MVFNNVGFEQSEAAIESGVTFANGKPGRAARQPETVGCFSTQFGVWAFGKFVTSGE
jgi:hypothetical protein